MFLDSSVWPALNTLRWLTTYDLWGQSLVFFSPAGCWCIWNFAATFHLKGQSGFHTSVHITWSMSIFYCDVQNLITGQILIILSVFVKVKIEPNNVNVHSFNHQRALICKQLLCCHMLTADQRVLSDTVVLNILRIRRWWWWCPCCCSAAIHVCATIPVPKGSLR